MLNRYWIPLATKQVPRATHLHAAVCEWFDRSVDGYEGVDHGSGDKPYRISAPASRQGQLGVELSTLTLAVDDRFHEVIEETGFVRLGSQQEVMVGSPSLLASTSWLELARVPAATSMTWRVHFMTPTLFRTGKHSHVLPTPSLVLGSAARTWNSMSGLPEMELPRDLGRHVLVTDLMLEGSPIILGAATLNGVTGYAEFRCITDDVAKIVAPLFNLLPYVGVGSHKARGLGCVDVESHRRRTPDKQRASA